MPFEVFYTDLFLPKKNLEMLQHIKIVMFEVSSFVPEHPRVVEEIWGRKLKIKDQESSKNAFWDQKFQPYGTSPGQFSNFYSHFNIFSGLLVPRFFIKKIFI